MGNALFVVLHENIEAMCITGINFTQLRILRRG